MKGFYADWRDEFGRRHRKKLPTQEGAALLQSHMRDSVRDAKLTLRSTLRADLHTTQGALDVYLASTVGAATTKAHLQSRLGLFVERCGQSSLAAITPQVMDDWINHRRQELAPTTLARDAGDLARWFRWLLHAGYILADPTRHLDLTQPAPARPHVLTHDEQQKILSAVTERIRLRLLLALDAGLRRGQISALRANHFDRTEKTLTVKSNKPPYHTYLLPCTNRLSAALTQATANLLPDTLLTCYGARHITHPGAFTRELWKRVGFHFKFHDLRHTFASRLSTACNNPFVIAALLGHTVRQTVFWRGSQVPKHTSTYVHPTLDELRHAIKNMEAANPNCRPPATENRKENPCPENASPYE